MPNTLPPASEYRANTLEIIEAESRTAPLDGQTREVDGLGPTQVYLKDLKVSGLGNYDKDTGAPAGTVEVVWNAVALTVDRGIRLTVDRKDQLDVIGLEMAEELAHLTRQKIIPELDAYRFYKYFSGAAAANKASETFTDGEAVIAAVDAAGVALDDAGSAPENRILFIANELKKMIERSVKHFWQNEANIDTRLVSADGTVIIGVPQARFNDEITLNSGASTFGYTAAGNPINFILLDKNAVWQAVKINEPKMLAWNDPANILFANVLNLRLLHDAGVLQSRGNLVYASSKEPPVSN
jgi:hypothetical protein